MKKTLIPAIAAAFLFAVPGAVFAGEGAPEGCPHHAAMKAKAGHEGHHAHGKKGDCGCKDGKCAHGKAACEGCQHAKDGKAGCQGCEGCPHAQAGDTVAANAGTHVCPMHPKVVQKGPGKCPDCGMDLVPQAKVKAKKK